MTRAQINRMNNVQVLQLGDYIRKGGQSLFVNRTVKEVCAQAEAALGFSINPSAVSQLADSLGVRIKRTVGGQQPGDGSKGSRLIVIAKALRDLYVQLGVEPPAALKEIVAHVKKGEAA